MPTTGPVPGSKNVLVAGAPHTFDLLKEFTSAKKVWVATAFAHWSGWSLIREALLKSSAEITLITGKDFCLTEPRVLQDWIGKDFSRKGVKAFIYHGPEIFHPKLFVIEERQGRFALIGSGNLSEGGLKNNVECFLHTAQARNVEQIELWLRDIVKDQRRCKPLTQDYIKEYKKKWKSASRLHKKIKNITKEASQLIARTHEAQMKNWMQAVSEARSYFKTKKFRKDYEQYRSAARRILQLLHHPVYEFSKEEWSEFYDIWHMGHLVPIRKYQLFNQREKLRTALRILADQDKTVQQRVDAIRERSKKTYVKYMGVNLLSKILASSEPKQYPVWNSLVEGELKKFNFKMPHGATEGEKYAAFADLMSQFMIETKAPDMIALDCFFCWKRRQSKD